MHLLMYFLQQHFGTCFVVSECKVELFNILGCQSTINESSKIFCMLVRQVASNPNDLTHFMLIPDRRKFKNCICIIEPLISSLSLFFTLLMLNFSGRGTRFRVYLWSLPIRIGWWWSDMLRCERMPGRSTLWTYVWKHCWLFLVCT